MDGNFHEDYLLFEKISRTGIVNRILRVVALVGWPAPLPPLPIQEGFVLVAGMERRRPRANFETVSIFLGSKPGHQTLGRLIVPPVRRFERLDGLKWLLP